ncbi:MAG: VOC family protein [Candidatus Saccharimonadales bacterium]
MNSIVHFEIPADDLDESKRFYAEAFDWEIREDKMPDGSAYISAVTTPMGEDWTPKEPGAINGALIKRDGELKNPVITVTVDSVEKAIEKVEKAGGKVVVPKATLEGVGDYAYIADPEGNVIGLWHDLPKE